jgi:hypothetical protein
MANNSEEGQGSQRAVVPVMMMMMNLVGGTYVSEKQTASIFRVTKMLRTAQSSEIMNTLTDDTASQPKTKIYKM